jgi:4-hydroxythreonine-4-phosphate dehydrogenase
MGDPAGIGPELVCRALAEPDIYRFCRPLVLGDAHILSLAASIVGSAPDILVNSCLTEGVFQPGGIDLLETSRLSGQSFSWGSPTPATGRAMIDYITSGIDLALAGSIAALVTCPINKSAMKLAGSPFHGHTELLAARTGTERYAMMMAGTRLRVVLVTIHVALGRVPVLLSADKIIETLEITNRALKERFGVTSPKIAVAGLNPHSGEDEMFGSEESQVIAPALGRARGKGIDACGPHPPDTLFHHAVDGPYDAVLCMYHDQGLIPFKLIHFADGVNTTLGLPIIRTSVDHGTAYDIAGKGRADPGSLVAAIRMAAEQAVNRRAASIEGA